MRLCELEKYDTITIQAHDNPDADAIASGFALYTYFKKKEKNVFFIYSGRYQIQKTDLKMLIEKLQIPIEYRSKDESRIDGILITVDCQYGAGNVQRFQADEIFVIDHHQQEIIFNELTGYKIASNLGSCSTLVWKMLLEAGYDVNEDVSVGTALYYGLFRDTNQFTELYYPLDRDMRESVKFDKSIIHLLRNSNLSLRELEIAGIALIRHIYNPEYHYAIIQTQPCDPNLLGLISDFLIQVDEIYTCVIFNYQEDGYKFSVRSCIKEVNASELAQFLSKDIGSGGGHMERAGGFLSERRFENNNPATNVETYFIGKLNEYFESFDILDASKEQLDISEMKKYEGKQRYFGYVKLSELLSISTEIVIRTMEGDTKLLVDNDTYVLIDDNCRIKIINEKYFMDNYKELSGVCDINLEYTPKIKIKNTNEYMDLIKYMKLCTNKRDIQVFAKILERGIKIFTQKNAESYLRGNLGDYLVVSCDDINDIRVVEQNVFKKLYQEIEL